MTVERPTFSESWHRVADLRPRLRAGVQTSRQRVRGRTWHVLRDGACDQFFRIDDPGYRFLGLLDGRRTVGEAWRRCAETLGDDAPTQPEALELLGRLSGANLLAGDDAGDARAVHNRRAKRRTAETRSQLMNFLFVRIPLFDPDALLDRWRPLASWLFTPLGAVLIGFVWLAGAWATLSNVGALGDGFQGALSAENIPLIYVTYVVIKAIHELAHGFACKTFGRVEGGGDVHAIGIMLLVFMPVPYVDASSSWAFASRARRMVVAGAGILAEITIAAIAAVVWAGTGDGLLHALAYNAMLVASVSTVLFNGNPLLRYDGYYVLSDALDIPNLWQRSRDHTHYLVKRFVFGVRNLDDPAHDRGERVWFVLYAVASVVYRVFLYAAIVWFLAERFFFLGILLAAGALVTFLVVPFAKFLRYLASSPELTRTRGRAVGATTVVLGSAVAVLALIPVPDHVRAEGVVEPTSLTVVHAGASGFVESIAPSTTPVDAPGLTLASLRNDDARTRLRESLADRRRTEARRRQALVDDPAAAAVYADQVRAVDEQIRRAREEVERLTAKAPQAGLWVSPDAERLDGAWVQRGAALGLVAELDGLVVRTVAPQTVAALLLEQSRTRVEMRVRGRPGQLLRGTVARDEIRPAGSRRLPSAALGYAAGGLTPIDPEAEEPTRARDRFFEAPVRPEPGADLLPGQRVIVRFRLDDKPLLAQGWRWLRQSVQGRLEL